MSLPLHAQFYVQEAHTRKQKTRQVESSILQLCTKCSENPEHKCVAPNLENFTEGWCHFPLQKEGYFGRGVSTHKTAHLRGSVQVKGKVSVAGAQRPRGKWQQEDIRKSKYTGSYLQVQDFEFVFTKILSLTKLSPGRLSQLGLNFGLWKLEQTLI